MLTRAWVKLLGSAESRADWSRPLLEELHDAGTHWALTYSRARRPSRVPDGARMFMGRLAAEPADILVYGRAIALAHVPERDEASAAEIAARPWKADWPLYLRVREPELVAGRLGNGVSLNAFMESLGADAFASTQRNAAQGAGNTDPRRAYRRQAHVELSPQGLEHLTRLLDEAFARYGKLSQADLATLDWPEDLGATAARAEVKTGGVPS